MKKSALAALAIVALASCTKENIETKPVGDKVAATFTSAAITRVANNEWVANDKIGISMVETNTHTLAYGSYENIPHTASGAGESCTFTPDDDIIYFPVDGSAVDFYAYYPHSTVDDENNIPVSVADQTYEHIDLIAAKATNKSKAAPTIQFSEDEAFDHQLSKLILTIKAGKGIDDLTGLTTTIKGQCTTAKFNIYTNEYSAQGDASDIEAITLADGSKSEAILIPTPIATPMAGIAGSTIVFSLDGNDYIWDTKDLVLTQGSQHSYEVTITKTEVVIKGATINDWNEGTSDSVTAE